MAKRQFYVCFICENKILCEETVCEYCQMKEEYIFLDSLEEKVCQRELKFHSKEENYDSFSIWNMFNNRYTSRKKQQRQMIGYLNHLNGGYSEIQYQRENKYSYGFDPCDECDPYFIKFLYSKYPSGKFAEDITKDQEYDMYEVKEIKRDLQYKWQNFDQLLYCIDSMFSNKYVTKKQWYQRKRRSTQKYYCHYYYANIHKDIDKYNLIYENHDFDYKLDNFYNYAIQVFQNQHQLKNTKQYAQNQARYHDLLIQYVYMQHKRLALQKNK